MNRKMIEKISVSLRNEIIYKVSVTFSFRPKISFFSVFVPFRHPGHADVICCADIITEINFELSFVVFELQHLIDSHCRPKIN